MLSFENCDAKPVLPSSFLMKERLRESKLFLGQERSSPSECRGMNPSTKLSSRDKKARESFSWRKRMRAKNRHFSKKLFEINSNWTSKTNVEGWNHYRISGRRRADDDTLELEMMAVCERDIRFWVPRSALRNEDEWAPGWK